VIEASGAARTSISAEPHDSSSSCTVHQGHVQDVVGQHASNRPYWDIGLAIVRRSLGYKGMLDRSESGSRDRHRLQHDPRESLTLCERGRGLFS
jgi:hypothetical protein